MGLNLKIKYDSPNVFRISPNDVSSKLVLQGDFNFPIMVYGSNTLNGGGGSSYDGGRTWIDASTLSYNVNYTYLEGGNVGGYTNLSPNGKDVMIWSWTNSGDCIKHLSNNGGRSWTNTLINEGSQDNFRWTHWNKNTNNAYMGGWNSGVSPKKSVDGGVTLTNLSTGLNVLNFDSADDESYVYGACNGNKSIVISTNQGTSWTNKQVGTEGDHRVIKCDATGQYVVVYYGNATDHACACYVSRDYAANFDAAAPRSAYARVAMTRDAGVITYDAFADASLFLSNNQGITWYSRVSPFDTSVVFFNEDYVNDTIYAWSRGYNEVYKLNDNKTGFNLFTTLDHPVYSFNASQYGRGYLYSHNIGGSATYFSRNGQTWQKVRNTAPVYLMVL